MKNFPKSDKFKIIYNLSWKFSVKILCKIASVSVSWYYKHKNLILSKNTKNYREKEDLELIKNIFLKSRQKYWYRSITMKLKWNWVKMNHKKVLRLMNKYNLLAKIRRKNPYKNIMKASQEHRTCENILKRKFDQKEPMKVLCTDITYLHYSKWRKAYLSAVKDVATKEIIWWKLSKNLWLWFVLNTINDLKKILKNKNIKTNEIIINSDQWFHYTSPQYILKIKSLWMRQSMSRKWNCLDNAPIESFFWHFKDDIDYKNCQNYKELENLIKNYMNYYNNERYQWWLNKMAPVQYKNYLMKKS